MAERVSIRDLWVGVGRPRRRPARGRARRDRADDRARDTMLFEAAAAGQAAPGLARRGDGADRCLAGHAARHPSGNALAIAARSGRRPRPGCRSRCRPTTPARWRHVPPPPRRVARRALPEAVPARRGWPRRGRGVRGRRARAHRRGQGGAPQRRGRRVLVEGDPRARGADHLAPRAPEHHPDLRRGHRSDARAVLRDAPGHGHLARGDPAPAPAAARAIRATTRSDRLLRYFLQVCNAVDYAHHRGVIHCDIKPANILLGDYGEVLLVDWGLAQSRDASARRPRRHARLHGARADGPRRSSDSTSAPTCSRSARSCTRSSPARRRSPRSRTPTSPGVGLDPSALYQPPPIPSSVAAGLEVSARGRGHLHARDRGRSRSIGSRARACSRTRSTSSSRARSRRSASGIEADKSADAGDELAERYHEFVESRPEKLTVFRALRADVVPWAGARRQAGPVGRRGHRPRHRRAAGPHVPLRGVRVRARARLGAEPHAGPARPRAAVHVRAAARAPARRRARRDRVRAAAARGR